MSLRIPTSRVMIEVHSRPWIFPDSLSLHRPCILRLRMPQNMAFGHLQKPLKSFICRPVIKESSLDSLQVMQEWLLWILHVPSYVVLCFLIYILSRNWIQFLVLHCFFSEFESEPLAIGYCMYPVT